MKYRHEWKHEINYSDMLILRQRLSAITKPDSHAVDGKYEIQSLYFDNSKDKALREKLDGVNYREKFRIRYYNDDTSFIRLEKKSKINGLCQKTSVPISKEMVQNILDGNYQKLLASDRLLIQELYSKIASQELRPKSIVSYTREPFIFGPGNVRVTLDYDIRTSLDCKNFLNPEALSIPVRNAPIILEVKWDEFLPDIIRDAVQLEGRRVTAFSKYAASRIYG